MVHEAICLALACLLRGLPSEIWLRESLNLSLVWFLLPLPKLLCYHLDEPDGARFWPPRVERTGYELAVHGVFVRNVVSNEHDAKKFKVRHLPDS